MKDGIIKGTGNSRFLKSVENFKTLYPTYDAFVTALVAGTLPIDLNGINAEGWEQMGDALGKYALLKDATAEALGLSGAALPDNALRVLSRLHAGLGNEYLWAKTGELSIVIGEMQSAQLSNSAAALITVQYSESVENVDGNIQLANPQTISFIASQYSSYIGAIVGKYANITSNQGHSCFGLVDSFNMQNSAALYATYYAVRISATQISYVNSPDPNAYPPDVDDGYIYQPLGRLGEKANIATGTYTGTASFDTNASSGTSGKPVLNATKNVVVGFKPKFVYIVGDPIDARSYWVNGSGYPTALKHGTAVWFEHLTNFKGFMMEGNSASSVPDVDTSAATVTATDTGFTITSVTQGLGPNSKDVVYDFIAIG